MRQYVIPVALLLLLLGGVSSYILFSTSKAPEAQESHSRRRQYVDQPFQALDVRAAGTFLRVPHSSDLNPAPGQHYLVVFWFKLRKLPEEGESFNLLRKFDSRARAQPGFRISLAREGNRCRPVVTWRNSSAQGGEYKFSAVNIAPKQWTLFALSWNPDQYLGFHAGIKNPDNKMEISLLGGYALALPVIPDDAEDLYIGSFGGTPFRGSFGPVTIVSTASRKHSLYKIFKEIGEDMAEVNSLFHEKDVKLLILDAASDKSSYHRPVEIVRPDREGRDSQDEEADERSEIGASPAGAQVASAAKQAAPPRSPSPAPVRTAPTKKLEAPLRETKGSKKVVQKSQKTPKQRLPGKVATKRPVSDEAKVSKKKKKPD